MGRTQLKERAIILAPQFYLDLADFAYR